MIRAAGALLLAVASLGTTAAAETTDAAPVAITGARIVTGEGPVIERGTIVLANGRVAALGGEVAIPAGAQVVDASGRTVYPGLIDALTTLGLEEIAAVRASMDVTEHGDVNPHARAWVALHPHSELIPVARANGVTAALAAPQGGLVSGQSALIRLAGSTPAALTVVGPAALHVVYPDGSADPATPRAERKPKPLAERLADAQANQRAALRRLGHLLENAKAWAAAQSAPAVGARPAPEPDPVREALVPAATGKLPVVIRADDEAEIRGAVAFAEAQGLALIVAGGLEAWRCADLLAQKRVPVLLKVDRLPRRDSDPYDAPFANAARLHAAGARFAIVTDDAALSRNLPYEAAMARAFGLPAEAALRAITLSPAEILGVAARMGSLAVGKDANLVIATGDILDHRTQVTHVFIEGVAQSLETRHTRLYEQFKSRP